MWRLPRNHTVSLSYTILKWKSSEKPTSMWVCHLSQIPAYIHTYLCHATVTCGMTEFQRWFNRTISLSAWYHDTHFTKRQHSDGHCWNPLIPQQWAYGVTFKDCIDVGSSRFIPFWAPELRKSFTFHFSSHESQNFNWGLEAQIESFISKFAAGRGITGLQAFSGNSLGIPDCWIATCRGVFPCAMTAFTLAAA